jgi:hypothetical protein
MNASSSPSGSKFLVLVLIAAIAGLGAWAFLLKRDLATANEELAAARKSAGTAASQAEVQRLKLKVAELESRPAAAPAPAPAEPKAAPAPANPASLVGQMLANPAMRSMVATQMRRTQETRYADLFARFGFTEEQRGRFLDILTENQEAMMDLSQKITAGNLSPEERAEIQRQGTQLESGIDARIRELLGDEGRYAEYKLYNEQQTERTQVTALQGVLARSSQPLRPEQAAALTDIMYQERKAAATVRSAADSADPAVALAPDAVETRIRQQEQLQARVNDRAASVLTPEQLAALRTTQANQLNSLRLGAEMARQMMVPAQPAAK